MSRRARFVVTVAKRIGGESSRCYAVAPQENEINSGDGSARVPRKNSQANEKHGVDREGYRQAPVVLGAGAQDQDAPLDTENSFPSARTEA